MRSRQMEGEERAGVLQVVRRAVERKRLDLNLLVLVGMRRGLGARIAGEEDVATRRCEVRHQEKGPERGEGGRRVPRLLEKLAARALLGAFAGLDEAGG